MVALALHIAMRDNCVCRLQCQAGDWSETMPDSDSTDVVSQSWCPEAGVSLMCATGRHCTHRCLNHDHLIKGGMLAWDALFGYYAAQ